MKLTSPTTWLRKLGLLSGQSIKRNPLGRRSWSHQPEILENRALLSASTIGSDTIMEVAPVHAKAAIQFPQVAGTWDVDVVGQGTGTVIVTQDGAKVTASFEVPTLGSFVAKGHFAGAHPHEIVSRVRVTIPDVGRVRIRTEINFPEDSANPTTFTGTAEAKGKHHFQQHFDFTGTKQGG